MKHIPFLFLLIILSACSPSTQPKAPTTDPYLIVLGVAQDAGYPQAKCQKACCKPVWGNPELQRLVSCLGLVDPDSKETWMFDATPDFKYQLNRLETVSGNMPTGGIFLTHGHIGHYSGLIHLGREVMGADAVPVYAMPRMRTFLRDNGPWSQLVSLNNIALKPLAADSAIQLNTRIQVTPVLVPHRDEFTETVGYLIQGPKRNALFIPDIDKWSKWDKNIRTLLREVDIAFLDGTFFANGEIPGRDMSQIPHPFMEETMELLADLPPSEKSKIHFIHFNHTNPVLRKGSPAAKQVLDAGFRLAEEGQVVEL